MRRQFNWAIPAFLAIPMTIAVLAALQVFSAASPDPAAMVDRCSTCHQMEEQVATWSASAHKDVACSACHADKGIWGWLHARYGDFKMKGAAKSEQRLDPEQIDTRVPNERCVECHAGQMPWVMVDLKPPKLASDLTLASDPTRDELAHLPALAAHDLHLTLENAVSCNACHADVSHGPVDQTKRQAFNHDVCQSCHTVEQVIIPVQQPMTCVACHLDLASVTPADHQTAAWRNEHGPLALETDVACASCHLGSPHGLSYKAPARSDAAPSPRLTWPDGTPVPDPGGFSYHSTVNPDQSSCVACHTLPMPHPGDWMTSHAAQFRQNPAACAQCHGTEGKGFDLRFTGNPKEVLNQPACASCHQVDMPHPAGWVSQHGPQAIASPAACQQCHTPENRAAPAGAAHTRSDFCTSCHAGVTMPHPAAATWRRQHGAAAQQDPASCNACHSPANVAQPQADHASRQFCASCHQTQLPHPTTWLPQHGDKFTADPQLCANCHGTTGGDFSLRYAGNPNRLPTDLKFCASCHQNQPMPHPAAWLGQHGAAAQSPGATCATCHSAANVANPRAGHASTQFCANCHQTPMPHPTAWPVAHGQAARQSGANCDTCHTAANPAGQAPHTVANYCLNCHLSEYRHPTGWVAAHKDAVSQAGNPAEAGCLTCHSQEPQGANTCATCHTGGPWHPEKMWWFTHGQAVKAQGSAACLTCHAEVEPSCLECHRSIP